MLKDAFARGGRFNHPDGVGDCVLEDVQAFSVGVFDHRDYALEEETQKATTGNRGDKNARIWQI